MRRWQTKSRQPRRLERDQLKHVVSLQSQRIGELWAKVEDLCDWSSGGDVDGTGVAIPSLIQIITDNASTMRQKIKAASAILNYRADSEITEFTKRFLQSVCVRTDIATDHRLEASEQLRRCEAPRIAPETVRPHYSSDDAPAEEAEPLADVVRWQRARCDELSSAIAREMGYVPPDGRTGSDEPSEAS